MDRLTINGITFQAYECLDDFNYIRMLRNYLDWDLLTIRHKDNLDFIREFEDYINWTKLAEIHAANITFLAEFQHRLP